MSCQHYNITVTGKVQGVWFRKYTFEKANELGLTGFVENRPDGNVYLEIEGCQPDKINQFIEWLNTGSPLSKVKKVDITKQNKCKFKAGFIIKR